MRIFGLVLARLLVSAPPCPRARQRIVAPSILQCQVLHESPPIGGQPVTKRRPLALGAAAALGLGSLFIAAPAMAEDPGANADTNTLKAADAQASAFSAPEDAKIAAAAELNGIPAAEIKQQLKAGEIHVSASGQIAFIDTGLHGAVSETVLTKGEIAAIPGSPAEGSRPGAPVTIYLDFDGATVENSGWNNPEEGWQESYTFSGSAADQATVWATVAEDYAGFNVNVTTSDPGADALLKTSEDDKNYGTHVVITDSEVPDFGAGSGGIAFLNSAGSKTFAPAFVFTQGVGGEGGSAAAAPTVVGMAAAHEVGHTLGLEHDGFGSEEYYNPDGGIWGPVMGAPYNSPLTQWSNGDYAQATNQQDDLAVMTDASGATSYFVGWARANGELYAGQYCYDPNETDPNNPKPGDVVYEDLSDDCSQIGEELTATFEYTGRAAFAADDHGNEAGDATALDNADGTFEATGVIGRTGDADVFKLSTAGGPLTATVAVAEVSPDLDAKLTLTDAAGTEIASDSPETTLTGNTLTGLDATVTAADVPEGTYYLTVTGVGQGDPATATQAGANGYSNYGSLGNYSLSGAAAAPVKAPLEAPVVTTPGNGDTTAEDPTFSGSGEPGAEVTITVTDASGTAVTATATVGEDGKWSVKLGDALKAGEYTVVAKQALDGETSPNSASVAFTVEATDAADANGTTGADGTDADANGTTGADGTDADANGTTGADGTDADANGTTGADGSDANGTTGAGAGAKGTADGSGDGTLADTGSASGFTSTLVFLTLALLVSGGAIAALAARQRKQQQELIG
ncbi:hypothetical protein D3248_01925 [Leucobacter zeae]|nr:hypothetical protein [Leucobacter zeae]